MSETKRTASSLPKSIASDFGKAHGLIGWKAYEHFSIANPLRECELLIRIVHNRGKQ
jgi:hypothetical protein